jgi:hypothetical protein
MKRKKRLWTWWWGRRRLRGRGVDMRRGGFEGERRD